MTILDQCPLPISSISAPCQVRHVVIRVIRVDRRTKLVGDELVVVLKRVGGSRNRRGGKTAKVAVPDIHLDRLIRARDAMLEGRICMG